jgi:cytochrome c peroxidase
VFGQGELEGLEIFLTEPDSLPLSQAAIDAGGIGNCVACHTPPAFTDFLFHNTGETQDEYDSIHGAGAFAALSIPNLATRDADFDAFLPPTAAHPNAVGPFLSVPSSGVPGLTDLGLWNVFANDDVPAPQQTLRTLLTAELGLPSSSTEDDLLPFTIAMFKTPGLRDLGQSAPYFHTGRKDRITEVVRFYAQSSTRARRGPPEASPPLPGRAHSRTSSARGVPSRAQQLQ